MGSERNKEKERGNNGKQQHIRSRKEHKSQWVAKGVRFMI